MPKDSPHNEKELLLRVAAGDQPAFQRLFNHYWSRMYANALQFVKSPVLAEDLTQEIFIKIWMNRERLLAVQRFDAFLYTTAKNLILDEFRKRVLPTVQEEGHHVAMASDLPSAQDKLELKDVEGQLHAAINQLPAQLQLAFRLSRFQGMSHDEIARQMNISRVTSKNYIARSIAAIRKYMGRRAEHVT
ncbi:RNA polymerase sigma factor [Chitinophaga sp.]|uniref:RNA polymerase sigma factor n=1 Tax=Chitinophaga sp. TaxID=1869181 RepID=UPI002F936D01